tara:strand:+ start:49 stop:225 length:177 start_codon:yes stop_codon:yes gene_type:complete
MARNNTWDGKGEMPEKSLEHPDYFPPKKRKDSWLGIIDGLLEEEFWGKVEKFGYDRKD